MTLGSVSINKNANLEMRESDGMVFILLFKFRDSKWNGQGLKSQHMQGNFLQGKGEVQQYPYNQNRLRGNHIILKVD